MDIGGININLEVNFGNVSSQLTQVEKATKSLAKSLEDASNRIANIGRIAEQATKETSKNMQQAANTAAKVTRTTEQAGKSLETNLKAASAGIAKIGETAEATIQKLVTGTEQASTAMANVANAAGSSLKALAADFKLVATEVAKFGSSAIGSMDQFNRAVASANRNTRTLATVSANTATATEQSFERIGRGAEKGAGAAEKASQRMEASLNAAAESMRNASNAANQAALNLASSILKAQTTAKNIGQTVTQSTTAISNGTRVATGSLSALGVVATQAGSKVEEGVKKAAAAAKNSGLDTAFSDASRSMRDAVLRIDKTLNQLSSTLNNFSATMGKANQAMRGAGSAASQASGGLVSLNKSQQDAVSGSANLGRFMRVLTTNIFGVNAISIALGTALGNLATQLVSRLVVALVQSITQFGILRNELATTSSMLNNVGQEVTFVVNEASRTGQSVSDVGRQWSELAEQARRAGVSIEKARASFRDWNSVTSIQRQRTLMETFRNLGIAIGELAVKFDSKTGVTSAVGKFFDRLTQGVKDLASNIQVEPEMPLLAKLEKELKEVSERYDEVLQREIKFINQLEKTIGIRAIVDAAARSAEEYLVKLATKRKELEQQIFELRMKGGVLAQTRTAQEEIEMEKIHAQIQRQLSAELDGAGKKNRAKEYSNKLSELEMQFRQAGIQLSAAELVLLQQKYGVQIKQIQALNVGLDAAMAKAAQSAQRNTDILLAQSGLVQNAILTQEQYAQTRIRIEKEIRDSVQESYEAELQLAELRIREQQRFQEAMFQTAQMAGQTLTALFPKSKAAAIAEAVINTAVGVTKAFRDVPWPLNWVQAGLVAASGAAQVAAIRSASPSGGGSVRKPNSGGSTSTGSAPAVPAGSIQIVIPKGDIWSSERVAELVTRINEEVANGRTLISTRTVPT